MATSPVDIGGRAFPFLKVNPRPAKPRTRRITEIRGPYYTPMGRHYLQDILETMGQYVDALEFAGGSFSLMPRRVVKDLINLCHTHDVVVSTGGFIESVLPQGPEAVHRDIRECKELGFDIVEISSGFITVPPDDLLRLVEEVRKAGLKAKPEAGSNSVRGGQAPRQNSRPKGRVTPNGPSIKRGSFWRLGPARS